MIGATNSVALNRDAFEKLFPGESLSQPHYVQAVNHVFRVTLEEGDEQGPTVTLNTCQRDQLWDYVDESTHKNTIQLRSYRPADPPKILSRALFEVQRYDDDSDSTHTQVDARELEQFVREALNERFLVQGQQVLIAYGACVLGVRLLKDYQSERKVQQVQLGESTQLDFKPKNRHLQLVEEVPAERIRSLDFKVSLIKPSDAGLATWHQRTSLPLVIDEARVIQQILEESQGGCLARGQNLEFKYDAYWRYRVRLRSAALRDRDPLEHLPVYRLTQESPLSLQADDDILLRSERPSLPAQRMRWCVTRMDKTVSSDERSVNYIGVAELKEQLEQDLQQRATFARERLRLELSTGIVELELAHASSDGDRQKFEGNEWTPVEGCAHSFNLSRAVSATLVESAEMHPLKTLRLHVSQDFGLDADAAYELRMGGPDPRRTLFMDQDELEQQIRDEVSHHLLKSDTLVLRSTQGEVLKVTVNGWDLEESDGSAPKYPRLGLLTEATKLEFTTDWVSLMRKSVSVNHANVEEKLKEMGVGGLSEELHVIVRDILTARGPARKLREDLGLLPPKGLLLYGPPGTGKTALTRQLGDLFGCEGDRFQLIAGSEIHSKWVGQSEANLRHYFEPARQAQERYGDESPLYIVAFDEFDSFAGARGSGGSMSSYQTSVVNQLLTLMDGLKPINNVLVVGITNHREKLDPALLRPGRFDTQLEIGIPDAHGRREIFEIHMKHLLENNLLEEDVSLERLVEYTADFTGARIRGLVAKASELLIDRVMKELTKLDELPSRLEVDHLKASEQGRLRWADVEEASALLGVDRGSSDAWRRMFG